MFLRKLEPISKQNMFLSSDFQTVKQYFFFNLYLDVSTFRGHIKAEILLESKCNCYFHKYQFRISFKAKQTLMQTNTNVELCNKGLLLLFFVKKL